MLKRIFLMFFIAGVIMVKNAQAQLPLETIHTFKLPCGLEVVLQKNNSAPVVAIQFWIKTGSAYETNEEAGISHLIEHVLFKGTKSYKPGEIAKVIEGMGGSINAFTTFDYTIYYVVMPAAQWKVGLKILADMVQNPLFPSKELAREKKVVLEEINRGKDSPFNILSESLFASAYKVYPYRRPIIGYKATVNGLEYKDISNYFQKWYKPTNMVAVIVGDIKEEEVKKTLSNLFTNTHLSTSSPQFPSEPPQTALRLLTLKKPFKETYLALSFPIPEFGTHDAYALDVLSEVLGRGEGSRLAIALKLKKPLVHSINTYAFTPKGPGLFITQAVLEAKNLKIVLKEIFTHIEDIKHDSISTEELAKAKLNLESAFIYKQETMEGWATTLGFFQVIEGEAKKVKDYLSEIKAITKEDIKEVAQKYLMPEHLSLVAIIPEATKTKLSEKEIYSLWPQKKQTKREQKTINKFVLDNGLTLLIKENHHLPTVAISAVFMGGLRSETTKTNGISNFTAEMLMRGTKKHSSIEVATLIEDMAGEIETFSGWNSFGLSAHFLSRFFERTMNLIAEILREPAFSPEETEKLRPLIISSIRQKEDKPLSLAFSQFYKTLFRNHPYGMDVLGEKETINRLQNTDLSQFYQTHALPNNLVLAVVGDIETKKVVQKVKELFGDWPKEKLNLANPSHPIPPSMPLVAKKPLPKEQVHFVLGNLGTTLYTEDKYALAILEAILAGQGGRLFLNLRDKKGLAYALTFIHREGIEPGAWSIYMATSPKTLDESIEGIKEEIKRLKKDSISEAEMKRARQYILGNFVIGLQTNSQQALSMALNERYSLGYNYDDIYQEKIKKVTKEEVMEVIESYLLKENYVLTLIGPLE